MSYDHGHDDGWNEALDALSDRLTKSAITLLNMVVHQTGRERERLQGRAEGIRLALEQARAMKRPK